MDDLFNVFDTMPFHIGMTPIMRPYTVKNIVNGEKVTSILTMIAESHISMHYFEDSGRAYFDLFSCRFFNYNEVIGKIKNVFHSNVANETLIARGSKYQQFRKVSDPEGVSSRGWLENVYNQS
jgi:hypothetical protein